MDANSFAVNFTHGVKRLFPLGFELLPPAPGVWSAYLHAQSLDEVADHIVRNAQPSMCIFALDHLMTDPATGDLLSVSEIARVAGVTPTMLDVDTMLIKSAELPAFLDDLPHYNMQLLDLPDSVSSDDAYEAVLTAVGEGYIQGRRVLNNVRQATVFIDSHDDCYLYIEARSRSYVLDHFGRLLQEFVAAQLNLSRPQIAPPTHSLLEDVLSSSGSCTMFDVHSELTNGRLRLGYSTVGYRLGDDPAEPKAYLTYDHERAMWSAG